MEILERMISNILKVIYEQMGYSLLLAVLFMFCYLRVKETGWKETLKAWWFGFKNDRTFRRVFLLALYAAMMLFRTLFNRELWGNPLSNIMGDWGLYDEKGEFTPQAIENVMLFIPFVVLLFWSFSDKIFKKKRTFWRILKYSVGISFIGSLGIEFLQLFLRVGTFQVSDLCYNTMGGIVGALIYWFLYKLTRRKNRKQDVKENQENSTF